MVHSHEKRSGLFFYLYLEQCVLGEGFFLCFAKKKKSRRRES